MTEDQLAADASRDATSADASSLPADAPSSRRKREVDTKTKRATTTLVFVSLFKMQDIVTCKSYTLVDWLVGKSSGGLSFSF